MEEKWYVTEIDGTAPFNRLIHHKNPNGEDSFATRQDAVDHARKVFPSRETCTEVHVSNAKGMGIFERSKPIPEGLIQITMLNPKSERRWYVVDERGFLIHAPSGEECFPTYEDAVGHVIDRRNRINFGSRLRYKIFDHEPTTWEIYDWMQSLGLPVPAIEATNTAKAAEAPKPEPQNANLQTVDRVTIPLNDFLEIVKRQVDQAKHGDQKAVEFVMDGIRNERLVIEDQMVEAPSPGYTGSFHVHVFTKPDNEKLATRTLAELVFADGRLTRVITET